MRALHETYSNAPAGKAGFSVLAFPCNQFGAQEPGSDAEVVEFATSKFDANFPIFSKIEVNGDGAAPLYAWLRGELPKEDGDGAIAWNFTKFLVDGDGRPIRRYEPQVTPEEIGEDLASMLG